MWADAVGGELTVVDVPGGHLDMIVDPAVRELARRISADLP